MKATLRLSIFLLLLSVSLFAQKKPTMPRTGKADTVATREWVRQYVQSIQPRTAPIEKTPETPVLPTSQPSTSTPSQSEPNPQNSEVQSVQFVINGTGNSLDFNDPDGVSPNMKHRFRRFVQEANVDAVRLVFSWGEYNPSDGVYRNAELAKGIRWVQNLRPNNPPKIRLLFVPILKGGDNRISDSEVQVDNNGNKMDCTYNSLFTTVPSYFSPTATRLLEKCYDNLFPFLKQTFGSQIDVVELGAGQSEEHYMPYTSTYAGAGCGTYSGLGDYSQSARAAFRQKYGTDLPNVGVTNGYNWNMNYSDPSFRNAAKFWGEGVFQIWDRFRQKAKQHTNYRVGVAIADLLNDQGAKFIFHGFALPKLIENTDVFYHTYNLSSSQWHGNLLGSDLIFGTNPRVTSEIEYDPHDCGTNDGFGPINEDFVFNSSLKILNNGARTIHYSMNWDDAQIDGMIRVINRLRSSDTSIKRDGSQTIEVKASKIYSNSYFLDTAWSSVGNSTGNPFGSKPVNLKLINDL